MRKDSTNILLVTVLITVAVVGGAYYLSAVRVPAADAPGDSPNAQSNGNALSTAIGSPNVSAETRAERSDTPIKCQHPELGEFWTNAATCEDADLDNRLSYTAPLATTPHKDRYSGNDYKAPARQAADKREDQKPDLRLMGKSPPDGLPVECKFPVGKALETERTLAAADNPYESKWRDTYCEFRCEVIEDNCPIRDDYFYYELRFMCEGTEHYPCYRPQS